MHNRTPRTMAEAFGHHSNNTLWLARPRPLKKRLGVLFLCTALIAILATAAFLVFIR